MGFRGLERLIADEKKREPERVGSLPRASCRRLESGRGEGRERRAGLVHFRERSLHQAKDLFRVALPPATQACHDHGSTLGGFITVHWVTVMAGRKACLPPTASRRSIARRVSVPPCS